MGFEVPEVRYLEKPRRPKSRTPTLWRQVLRITSKNRSKAARKKAKELFLFDLNDLLEDLGLQTSVLNVAVCGVLD